MSSKRKGSSSGSGQRGFMGDPRVQGNKAAALDAANPGSAPHATPPPAPPDDDEQEYKTIIQTVGDSKPASISLESLMKAPTGFGPSAKPAFAPPPMPPADADADAEDEQEYKTIIATTSDPKAPAAPSISLESLMKAPAGFGKGASSASLPVPPPPPTVEDEQEYKTVIATSTDGPKAAPISFESLMKAPAPLSFKKAAPPKAPEPEEEEQGYKTIMLGAGLPSLLAKPAPGAPAPAADGDDQKTMIAHVADSRPVSMQPVAGTPQSQASTNQDVFGGATVIGTASNTNPPTNPPTNQGSWPGVTGSGSVTNPGVSTHVGMPDAGMYINQYEIIRKLGEGGMGAVFLARDTRLGRRVAIKFLSSTDPELTKRFVIEARATARVEHENIVSIYEVGEWGGHPFMVLQFLQGNELSKVIPRGKPMPVPRVVEIMMPVLRALAYAHSEGIVHRDLKPDNIFITDGGVTKVLDFGIAKVVQGDDKTSDGEAKLTREDLAALGPDKGMTRHGAVMGTMPFMSPEQWGNGIAIDHTSDIWAVGVMMYIMLSGRHPLYPLSGHELMVTAFLDEPMPKLKEKAPDLSKEICDLVDKALEKEKGKRWPDALALLRALEPLLSARTGVKLLSSEDSPYAGLAAFQEDDAGRFFGRSRETAAMTQRLRERPLMGVIGPSGIGKSSFLRAGVVPALKGSGDNWEIKVIRPGTEPLMALAGLLTNSGSATSSNIKDDIEVQQKMADRLRKEPGYLGTALRRTARREKKNLLLFIDQFEELYTLVPDQDERLAYTACVAAAADDPTSPMRVVVSMRSDFLDRCTEDLNFMNELSQGLFFLTPMTREGMREALALPAEMAGYKFEKDEMINEMLDHLASTSGALPLLQFTADMLWGERDPTRKVLTEKSYRNLGGISGALATHAERVIEQTSPEQRTMVRALFLRLVTPERTRAIVSLSDLKDQLGKQADVGGLIDQLVAARLLTVSSSGGGAATVEIVHESLIHGWPQLARWLDEGQEDAAFLEQLRNASRQWGAKNKDTGLLWRGEMVGEAKRFVRRHRGTLPEVQQHFLKAVIDSSNRAARIKKAILVAAGIVVLALLAAAAVALYIINDSRAETQKQAVVAQESEKRAKVAAVEAEERKVEAEKAKEQAELALAEAKAADLAKEEARRKEAEAIAADKRSREQLALALIEAQEAEKKAVRAAAEATAQKAIAETRAKEAMEARNAASKSAEEALVAKTRAEKLQREAEAQAKEAVRRLNEMTRGGVIEVLQ